MSSRKTYPKEGEQKLKEKIKDLRSELRQLRKENKILKQELNDIVKPSRKRKPHVESTKLTEDQWRDSFIKRVNESIKKREK